VSAAVVIDLGDDWAVADEPPAGRRRRPPSRGPLAVLVLVAVLLLTAASAAPRPPLVAVGSVPAQGASSTEVGDGALFVGTQTNGGRTVTRYPLAGSPQVWSVTVPGPPEYLLYLHGPRTVLVESYNSETNQSRFAMLDAATGHQLWDSTGDLILDGPGTEEGALLVNLDNLGIGRATFTDLRTGRPLWTRAVRSGTQLVPTDDAAPPDATGYLFAEADGTVTLVARRTGAVLATGQVGQLALAVRADSDPDNRVIVNVVGDRLVVLHQMGLKATIDSYTLPALRPEWSRTGMLAGFPGDCGAVLCLGESNDLVGLDPTTGTTRWRAPGWQWADDLGGGRLLGYRQGNGQQVGVLDAGTGRLLLDLGDWAPVQGAGGHSQLLIKPDRDFKHTWFAALDADRPGVRVLARLAGVSTAGCDPHGDLLVCRTLDARLQVWRYQG
jgi:hypothetical protein